MRDFEQAEPYARRAWEIRQKLLGPNHPDSLADACALAGLCRYAESEPIYVNALRLFRELFGEMHVEVAATLNNLAAIRMAQGDALEAESFYLRSFEIKRWLLGDCHPDTALTMYNYAFLLAELGRTREARTMARHALKVFDETLESSHPRIAAARAKSPRPPSGRHMANQSID